MTMYLSVLLLICTSSHFIFALDNGLALTPPMGWLSWERFRCNVDCKNDPANCISEKLYMKMADLMVSEGFRDAGYEYINIDDCWPAMERDSEGRLVADPERFPSGIKALANYIHGKGLKLGIYEDFGHSTCAGYPGSEFYMQTDANTFAEWNVDMLKFDGCNSDPNDMPYGYPIMERFLNLTGKPILFLCQWPGYLVGVGIQDMIDQVLWKQERQEWNVQELGVDFQPYLRGKLLPFNFFNEPNYTAVRQNCNQWRNYKDVQDSWDSVLGIIDHYGDDKDGSSKFAGPGGWNDPDMTCNLWRNYEDVTDSWSSVLEIIDHYGDNRGNFSAQSRPGAWNDPDMLVVGDFGLSYYQQKAQFGMWALLASPLMMSVDLRSIDPDAKSLLLNKNIIAINQDPLGNQAFRLFEVNGFSVWIKNLQSGCKAIGFLNKDNQGRPRKYTTSMADLGLTANKGFNITEAFEHKYVGSFKVSDEFTTAIDPTSIYIMIACPF